MLISIAMFTTTLQRVNGWIQSHSIRLDGLILFGVQSLSKNIKNHKQKKQQVAATLLLVMDTK
jgi:hypothetical protein